MPVCIALLRAVNVGGTGKLPMTELKSMCEAIGCLNVRTYIASGNVIFETPKSKKQVQRALETQLESYLGKPVGVIVRTPAELEAVLEANPFPGRAPDRTVVVFLDDPLPVDSLKRATGIADEEMQLGLQSIYIHYSSGIGKSKLKIPDAKNGTARNVNTIAKLVELSKKY